MYHLRSTTRFRIETYNLRFIVEIIYLQYNLFNLFHGLVQVNCNLNFSFTNMFLRELLKTLYTRPMFPNLFQGTLHFSNCHGLKQNQHVLFHGNYYTERQKLEKLAKN